MSGVPGVPASDEGLSATGAVEGDGFKASMTREYIGRGGRVKMGFSKLCE